MSGLKAKYVNPFTDFGFKKIFGEEACKPMLIDFLNCVLPESKIADLSFQDKEKLSNTIDEGKAVFDIYCENINGEKIIVELQKAKQNYFKDRTIYYSSFPIQEQANKGDWNFNLKAVYCVGILDFKFDDDKHLAGEVIHTVQLKDQNNQVFYDKLKFVYLEMPHFNKSDSELITRLDKWLYFIKHLEDFQSIPAIFSDEIFVQAFEKAEIANYNQTEMQVYQESLKTYRDLKNVIDTSFEDGKIEAMLTIAKNAKAMGLSAKQIVELTGLSEDEIKNL